MCKNLQVKCVSHGDTTVEEKLAIKKVIWKENDNEIRAALKELKKCKTAKSQNTKKKETNT